MDRGHDGSVSLGVDVKGVLLGCSHAIPSMRHSGGGSGLSALSR